MNVVNLKWHDAMNTLGRHFTQAEHDAGWPDAMTADQLAALQRPYAHANLIEKRKTVALFKTILHDCETKTLHHQACSIDPNRGKDPFSFERMTATFRDNSFSKPTALIYITATDFAAWLAAQREAPSKNIQAWFDAVAPAGKLLDAVDSEPGTFTELVALRKAKPRSVWTESARKILKFEIDKRTAQPCHRKTIAATLGVTVSRIGQVIDPNWQPKRRPAANLRSVKR